MGQAEQKVNPTQLNNESAAPEKVAVLFDLDGVLIDSERKYTKIWEKIDQMYPTGVKDFPHVIKGTTIYDILDRYFRPEDHKAVYDFGVAEEKKLTFNYMPGAREVLVELKRLGVPAVMVTSSDGEKMKRLKAMLPDIFQWFSGFVTAEMITRGKPDPEPYLLGAEMAGVEPRHCAVIEDALTGLASGRAAGCYTVGMTDTLGRAAITDHADLVLDSLADLNLPRLLDIISNR